jgi:hypothetical protein
VIFVSVFALLGEAELAFDAGKPSPARRREPRPEQDFGGVVIFFANDEVENGTGGVAVILLSCM